MCRRYYVVMPTVTPRLTGASEAQSDTDIPSLHTVSNCQQLLHCKYMILITMLMMMMQPV